MWLPKSRSEKLELKTNNKQKTADKKEHTIPTYLKAQVISTQEETEREAEQTDIENRIKELTLSELHRQETPITVPEKLRSNEELRAILVDYNFRAIFVSLKQKWYTLSVQVVNEWTRSESFALSITWNNKNTTSSGSRLGDKKKEFIDLILQLPKGDLVWLENNIKAVAGQVTEGNDKATNKLDQELTERKNVILAFIDHKNFWSSSEYSGKRYDLASLLNTKDRNGNFIITDQDLQEIKQSIVKFAGADNVADSNTIMIWSENWKITIEGAYLNNRSTPGSRKREIKKINEPDTRLDISKIWVTINGKILTTRDDEKKWNELVNALNQVLWEGNYTILKSQHVGNWFWFKDFALTIQPLPGLYLDGEKVDGELPLTDYVKDIEVRWNQIIVGIFGWWKNILEIRK